RSCRSSFTSEGLFLTWLYISIVESFILFVDSVTLFLVFESSKESAPPITAPITIPLKSFPLLSFSVVVDKLLYEVCAIVNAPLCLNLYITLLISCPIFFSFKQLILFQHSFIHYFHFVVG